MGNGIAQVFAQAGFTVRLVDVAAPMLDRARATIEKSVGKFVEKGKLSAADRDATLGRLSTTTSIDRLLDADFVVEAIVENAEIKSALFGQHRRHHSARHDSGVEHVIDFDHSARRGDEAAGQSPRHALHEPGAADDAGRDDSGSGDVPRVDAGGVDLCKALGKTPVESADYPGFIANRILMPMINEAIFAVMEGVGTPEAIDAVMKLGMNQPMGPLTLADFIGLDVCLAILNVLLDGIGDPKYRPCPLLRRMVRGVNSGASRPRVLRVLARAGKNRPEDRDLLRDSL